MMLPTLFLGRRTRFSFSLPGLLIVCVIGAGLWFFAAQAANAVAFEGFGNTPGGTGQPVVHVTNLNDSGAGSLREALSAGNRTIVFDVSGTITLTSYIKVKGAFITVDGCSAAAPKITLANFGLYLSGTKGVNNIIIQCVRIRNAIGDAITIRDGSHHVVIDHVSLQKSTDGNLDLTRGASDVTVQWSIIAENDASHNLLTLVDLQALRVTFHHNLFVKGQSRNPHTGWDGTLATFPPDTVADIRNNLIWDFSAYGTLAMNNVRSNVVQNFYYSSTQSAADRALRVNSGGQAYASGNFSPNIVNIDGQGNAATPFPAAPVTTTHPCIAAQEIVDQVGVRPLDTVDQGYIDGITLPDPCP
jgi:hypothetical protein